jgi:hypothetical protein
VSTTSHLLPHHLLQYDDDDDDLLQYALQQRATAVVHS